MSDGCCCCDCGKEKIHVCCDKEMKCTPEKCVCEVCGNACDPKDCDCEVHKKDEDTSMDEQGNGE